MGDLKSELSKHFKGSGGNAVKKCKCGKSINKPEFDQCYSCSQNGKTGATQQSANLPDGYLVGGYFDEKENLSEKYIVEYADDIANKMCSARPAMTNHQLRRFYGHVRANANRLEMTANFHAVYIDLKKLVPFVSEAKGKGKVPDLFYNFIINNLKAIRPEHEEDFTKGFLEHFQAVVAFFTFHYSKK